MKNNIYKFAIAITAMVTTAIGVSLGIKAAVGVGAWDALSISVSTIIGMKVGTFSMIMNISCVLIQLLILKKDFKLRHGAQVLAAMVLGTVVNFMIYNILDHVVITSYPINLALLVLSVLICATSVSVIMTVNFITFPLESCCMVVAQRLHKNFGLIRQGVDIAAIILSLAISLLFKDAIHVREGTIIAMVLFGPLLNLIMGQLRPGLVRFNLAEDC